MILSRLSASLARASGSSSVTWVPVVGPGRDLWDVLMYLNGSSPSENGIHIQVHPI